MTSTFNAEKYAKLVANRAALQTGGRGSVRRKKAVVHKQGVGDDRKLKATLSKLQVRDIPAIEEVNMFKDDGNVIHFNQPKVQASIAANTYVINGTNETKKLADLLPGIITQLGPDSLNELKRIYQAYAQQSGANLEGKQGDNNNDDDDVPDLVENFEEVSKQNENKQ